MVKLSDRAKDRFKGLAERMESSLKDIAYHAGMAAKTVAKFVRGVLNGQHRP
jgi:hypothetical protein